MPECRTCGAPVVWGVTAYGKRMPLDELLVRGGKWILTPEGKIIARPSTLEFGRESHFATCPQADQHRRPR